MEEILNYQKEPLLGKDIRAWFFTIHLDESL